MDDITSLSPAFVQWCHLWLHLPGKVKISCKAQREVWSSPSFVALNPIALWLVKNPFRTSPQTPKNPQKPPKNLKKGGFTRCKKWPFFAHFCAPKVDFRILIERKSAKNVSGHRYFLQYPPNLKCCQMAKKGANNVLFRYPPPPLPPPTPSKGPF